MSPLWLLLLAAPAPENRYGAAPAPAPPAVAAAPSFERRLTALELALSTTVVERPTLWRLDGLRAEAAALLAAAGDESQKQAVRSVADRIDRFANLAGRYRQRNDLASGWRSPGLAQTDSTRRVRPPVQLTKAAPTPSAAYDVQGVLRPVVSKRPDAPKYGVVDDEGRLAALVTPSPDLEARFDRLLGQRVGLTGRRSFLTDLRRNHVVAERVTSLDTLRR